MIRIIGKIPPKVTIACSGGNRLNGLYPFSFTRQERGGVGIL